MKARLLLGLLLIFALCLVSFSPTRAEKPICAESWTFSFTLEFAPGYWEVGSHQVEFLESNPWGSAVYSREFQVTEQAPLHKGQVIIRAFGNPTSADGSISEFNPAQDTAMQITYFGGTDRKVSESFRAAATLQLSWDGGEWVDVPAGPLTKACAFDNPAHFLRTWGKIFKVY
jgi:hypothetical protein